MTRIPYVRCFAGLVMVAASLSIITGRAAAQPPQVHIDNVTIDDARITITGKNFDGAVTVTVGETVVAIVSATNVEIVADRPQLATGTHIIVVARDGGATPEDSARSSLLVR